LQGSDTDVTSVEPTENVEQEEKRQQPKTHPTHGYKLNVLVCHAPQLLEKRIHHRRMRISRNLGVPTFPVSERVFVVAYSMR
jgi:hypothetical protein